MYLNALICIYKYLWYVNKNMIYVNIDEIAKDVFIYIYIFMYLCICIYKYDVCKYKWYMCRYVYMYMICKYKQDI